MRTPLMTHPMPTSPSDSAASEQLDVPSSKAVEKRQELLMMLV